MKPTLKLSKSEKLFWPILTAAKTTAWDDLDNLLASQMCRDLATVEELAQAECGEELLADTCKRIYQGSQLLKLTGSTTGKTAQHKIIQTIFAGV